MTSAPPRSSFAIGHSPIAVPPAIVNAAVDALAPFGCRHLDMPVTAEKIWRVLHAGGR